MTDAPAEKKEALEPCPWCGSTELRTATDPWVRIMCLGCGAEGPTRNVDNICAELSKSVLIKAAIAAWNGGVLRERLKAAESALKASEGLYRDSLKAHGIEADSRERAAFEAARMLVNGSYATRGNFLDEMIPFAALSFDDYKARGK